MSAPSTICRHKRRSRQRVDQVTAADWQMELQRSSLNALHLPTNLRGSETPDATISEVEIVDVELVK
jgi:hypothetical protein